MDFFYINLAFFDLVPALGLNIESDPDFVISNFVCGVVDPDPD